MAGKPKRKKAKPARKTGEAELTPQQRLFVLEYLHDFNGKQAAIRAGYSEKSAESQASRLLSNAKVNAFVAERMVAREKRLEASADGVLQRLMDELEADIADIYDDNGHLLPIKEWPKIWRTGLVSGLETEQLFEGSGKDREQIGNVIKIKHSDRVRRLEMLGKHINVGAFRERVAVDVEEPLKALYREIAGHGLRPGPLGPGINPQPSPAPAEAKPSAIRPKGEKT